MRCFFLFTFLFTQNISLSQTVKALQKAADEAFAEEDYYSAMVHLSDALEIDPENGHFKNKKVMDKYWSRDYEKGWEPPKV